MMTLCGGICAPDGIVGVVRFRVIIAAGKSPPSVRVMEIILLFTVLKSVAIKKDKNINNQENN